MGFETRRYLEQYDSVAKDVDFRRKQASFEKLIGKIRLRPQALAKLLAFISNMTFTREPEVANFRFTTSVEQNVSWLDVRMDQGPVLVRMKKMKAPESS